MHAPSVTVTVSGPNQKVAIGGVRIDARQCRLASLEDFAVEPHADRGKSSGAIGQRRAPGGCRQPVMI
ncbi:MAG: hypothetical protein ACOYMG_00080 [Candidatus Methylumidiphilus sp.]